MKKIKQMKTSIVIGLGFGDEGKGLATQYLCQQSKKPLVIRFSGGHQAGHTVVLEDGRRHVFSNFGAGTLRGAPTYWSQYCSFNPLSLIKERKALEQLQLKPKIYVDALAKVTTPYDIYYNQMRERSKGHGSCGLGFGATMSRNETPNKLYVQDLAYPEVVKQRLEAIKNYYTWQSGNPELENNLQEELSHFMDSLPELLNHMEIVHEKEFLNKLNHYDQLVFEGSQGVLLDMDHGFFPNVTYANTTSKNAMAMIQQYQLASPKKVDIYYISRAYQTRHGNGFLSNEDIDLDYIPNPKETNQYNQWQGAQRVSPIDLDMLQYALDCDANYSGSQVRKHFIITCLDQLKGKLIATRKGKKMEFEHPLLLAQSLPYHFSSVLESHSPVATDMILRKRILAA